jgi:hypothetical protein
VRRHEEPDAEGRRADHRDSREGDEDDGQDHVDHALPELQALGSHHEDDAGQAGEADEDQVDPARDVHELVRAVRGRAVARPGRHKGEHKRDGLDDLERDQENDREHEELPQVRVAADRLGEPGVRAGEAGQRYESDDREGDMRPARGPVGVEVGQDGGLRRARVRVVGGDLGDVVEEQHDGYDQARDGQSVEHVRVERTRGTVANVSAC